MLTETRNQLQSLVTSTNSEITFTSDRLNEKNTEIEKLNNSYRVLKQELGNLQEENLSLKSQLSDSYDDLNKLKYRMNSTGTAIDEGSISSVQSTDKPIVYLIGTSNIQGIDETKLTHAAKVTKFTAYTLEETINCISRLVQEPNIIVLHVLTNDLKTKSPQLCANQLSDVVSSIFEKWCTVKIVVSLTTPRNDSILHNTNGQIINALVKHNLSDRNVVLVDHSNMCSGGNPIPDLLSNDHYHLSAKGVAQLASNIKRAIHSILGVPLPVRQPHHSRSRSRRGRGRGLLQGGCGK
jgi:hypothetical protein